MLGFPQLDRDWLLFKDLFQNSLRLTHYTIDKVAAQIRLRLQWYIESNLISGLSLCTIPLE